MEFLEWSYSGIEGSLQKVGFFLGGLTIYIYIYIYIYSINVDSIWIPVKTYIKDEMKVDTEKRAVFVEEYIATDVQQVKERHHKVTEYQKKNEHKTLNL